MRGYIQYHQVTAERPEPVVAPPWRQTLPSAKAHACAVPYASSYFIPQALSVPLDPTTSNYSSGLMCSLFFGRTSKETGEQTHQRC